jgi:hypothetical protein
MPSSATHTSRCAGLENHPEALLQPSSCLIEETGWNLGLNGASKIMRALIRFIAGCALFAFCAVGASAAVPRAKADFIGYRPVSLHNGFNQISLAGQSMTVASAWRENYNAHGFTVATMYVEAGTDPDRKLLLVPLFGNANDALHERYEVLVDGGADCLLNDFRLLMKDKQALLVRATRELGTGYAEAAPVHFDVYRFERNTDALPGWPPFDFRFDRRIEASHAYCDVDEAMKQELGF